MAGLSLAASKDMPKRGFLEVLRDPPSLTTSMEIGSNDGTVSTYSGVGAITFAPIALSGALLGIHAVGITFGIFSILCALVFIVYTFDNDQWNKKVLQALVGAARDAARGYDVSISGRINNEAAYRYDGDYVESLSYRQQLWVEKQWKKEFDKAEQKELASESTAVSSRLDGLLNKERTAEITRHKEAMKEIRAGAQRKMSEQDAFDHELASVDLLGDDENSRSTTIQGE